jgi:hypothetical protein
MKRVIYLYRWLDSDRFAIFDYPLELLPASFRLECKFYNPTDLYLYIKNLARFLPSKSLGRANYVSCKLNEYNYNDAYADFMPKEKPNQLTLDI